MKNNCKFALPVLFFAFFLISCSQEPIFYSIEQEIKLKEPTIKNIVYSMIEYPYTSGTLYAANGRIYTKTNGRGDWSTSASPGFTIRLASDDSGMYAITQKTANEATTYSVFYRASAAGSTWTAVSSISGSIITIFDDQRATTGQKAYVTVYDTTSSPAVYKVYKLNGTGAPTLEVGAVTTEITRPVAAAFINGTTVFSNYRSIITGDTGSGPFLYRLNEGTAQCSGDKGATWTKSSTGGLSSGSSTAAIALYDKGGAGNWYLLAGTTSGGRAVKLKADGTFDGGFMELASAGIGTNAAGALNGAYVFSGGFFVCNTPAGGNNIYAASVHRLYSERSGLWAYYPSAGVWNRE